MKKILCILSAVAVLSACNNTSSPAPETTAATIATTDSTQPDSTQPDTGIPTETVVKTAYGYIVDLLNEYPDIKVIHILDRDDIEFYVDIPAEFIADGYFGDGANAAEVVRIILIKPNTDDNGEIQAAIEKKAEEYRKSTENYPEMNAVFADTRTGSRNGWHYLLAVKDADAVEQTLLGLL
jgi:hypothetical protein